MFYCFVMDLISGCGLRAFTADTYLIVGKIRNVSSEKWNAYFNRKYPE